MLKQYYNNLGINEEVYQFCSDIEEKLRERFQEIDRIAEYNQLKVLTAMQKNQNLRILPAVTIPAVIQPVLKARMRVEERQ